MIVVLGEHFIKSKSKTFYSSSFAIHRYEPYWGMYIIWQVFYSDICVALASSKTLKAAVIIRGKSNDTTGRSNGNRFNSNAYLLQMVEDISGVHEGGVVVYEESGEVIDCNEGGEAAVVEWAEEEVAEQEVSTNFSPFDGKIVYHAAPAAEASPKVVRAKSKNMSVTSIALKGFRKQSLLLLLKYCLFFRTIISSRLLPDIFSNPCSKLNSIIFCGRFGWTVWSQPPADD